MERQNATNTIDNNADINDDYQCNDDEICRSDNDDDIDNNITITTKNYNMINQ